MPARLCALTVSPVSEEHGLWTTAAFSSRHRSKKYLTLNDAGACPDGHNDDASGCRLGRRLKSCLFAPLLNVRSGERVCRLACAPIAGTIWNNTDQVEATSFLLRGG
jgi:hypothetical protein